MRVLLSNWTLAGYGGSERWTYDMARAIIKAGHSVQYFTFEHGIVSDKLNELGATAHDGSTPELIIANHYSTVDALKAHDCRIIQTIHGPKHKEEQPHPRADRTYAVSDEIAEKYGLGIVARNSVDLTVYTPKPGNIEYKVLCLCQGQDAGRMAQKVADKLKFSFTWCSKFRTPTWDMAELINRHDIVIGAGRGIVEALACGKQVIVCDSRDYYPQPLINLNMKDAMYHNYSGRGKFSQLLTVKLLTEALTDFNRFLFFQPRAWAEKYHNIENNLSLYLS